MPIMEINIIPLGARTPSVSQYIRSALKVLREKKDIKYELTAMATFVQADSLDLLLALARKMHQEVLSSENIKRVVTTIKVDDRKDKKSTMEEKIRSVDISSSPGITVVFKVLASKASGGESSKKVRWQKSLKLSAIPPG